MKDYQLIAHAARGRVASCLGDYEAVAQAARAKAAVIATRATPAAR